MLLKKLKPVLCLRNYISTDQSTCHGFEQEHRELAKEAVRKSLVLLKNGMSVDKPLLPLPKKAPKILVAGSHADNLGYQCGGWTIQWQGLSGNDLTIGMSPVILY